MPDAFGTTRSFCTLPPHLECILEALPKPRPIGEIVQARDEEGNSYLAYRAWKHSVYKYLEPLHGSRGDELPERCWYFVATRPGEKDRKKYAVERPPLRERIERYKQALGVAYTFASWEDLVPLAVCRRQVTNVGGVLEIDRPLYLLMWKARRFYRPLEIRSFAERMPPRSNIRGRLYGLAARRLREGIQEVLYSGSSVPD